MATKVLPPLALVLMFLRRHQGWSQQRLAEVTGIAANLLSDYEHGRKVLYRERLELIVAALGLSSSAIDIVLDSVQSIRATAAAPGPANQRSSIEAVAAQTGQLMSAFTRDLLGMLTSQTRAITARERAAALWERLKRLAPEQRRLRVEESRELRTWALSELICEESVRAAADSADRALDLASLALRVAELMPGDEAWRSRVQGYAWAHVGNARRVRGDLPGADKAFSQARKLWDEGKLRDPGFLNEACVFGLEASLRQSQRRLTESLDLLEKALKVDQGGLARHLYLSQAKTLEELGDIEGALEALSKAAPLVEAEGEPRLLFTMKFNMAVNFCFLGWHDKAGTLVPKLRVLAEGLGNSLDLTRLRWLEGRIAAGLGNHVEAVTALSRVRDDFASREIAYDMALVSLELAVLHLGEARTNEVKTLARQMAPVFRAQGVHREALAALNLFREAAESEAVTVDLARQLFAYLLRAQHNPELRFELIPWSLPGPA